MNDHRQCSRCGRDKSYGVSFRSGIDVALIAIGLAALMR